MRIGLGRATSCVGIVASMAVGFVGSAGAASAATPANAVTWNCFNGVTDPSYPGQQCPAASFSGYGTASEVHLGALANGATQVANLDQAFSGASTASAGLTNVINSETTSVVQPAEAASVRAYGTGSGLEVGVGTDTLPKTDQNQLKVAGRFEITAPPDTSAPAKQIGPLPLGPLGSAALLTGSGSAIYDTQVCPIGQPISYGLGNAAGVNLTTPLASLTTAGTGASVAQTTSQTFLSSNGDGTFGLTTQSSDIIAPVSANIAGVLPVNVLVQGIGGVGAPVMLTAKTTGESTGASLTFSPDDVLKVVLGSATLIEVPLSAIGPGGLHIPLSTSNAAAILTTLQGTTSSLANTLPAVGPTVSSVLSNPALGSVLQKVGTTTSQVTSGAAVVNLGYIDVDTAPHVIGAPATDLAKPTGGTLAAGALDLLHLHLALSGTVGTTALPTTQIADFSVGHLQVSSALSAPIICKLPVVKASNPTAVRAGQSFTYNIEVPDPAKLGLVDCDLSNMTVTDTITDKIGSPTFTVTGAKDTATGEAGVVDQVSPTKAIVTWTGLSYKVARSGPPNAPIPLSIYVTVPASSPAGLLYDDVVAVATATDCTGGASASTTAAAGGNGAVLTGNFPLDQPSVAIVAATAPGGATELPHTGGMGGLWQPVGGLAVLGIGGGALALVRRARRLQKR